MSFTLEDRDVSVWNLAAHEFQVISGTYNVYVGSSSRKLPLQGTMTV